MSTDFTSLPDNLPVPEDDGAADHLPGSEVPAVALPSTLGGELDLARAARERLVVYVYPRTGVPGQPLLDGWDDIPGARGCTPQSCGFRDRHGELQRLGARVFGLSTQTTADQREAVDRLHLPFPLLSDETLEFQSAMRLPSFEIESMRLVKRLTLIIRDGTVEHVFYPVFPPDRNAAEV
ncbi:MAG TPA: peroxiredoxin, partial [Solirubrobacteraceae bacterium]